MRVVKSVTRHRHRNSTSLNKYSYPVSSTRKRKAQVDGIKRNLNMRLVKRGRKIALVSADEHRVVVKVLVL